MWNLILHKDSESSQFNDSDCSDRRLCRLSHITRVNDSNTKYWTFQKDDPVWGSLSEGRWCEEWALASEAGLRAGAWTLISEIEV